MTLMTLSFISLYQREESSHLYSTVKSVCELVCENASKIYQNGENQKKPAKQKSHVFNNLLILRRL